MSVCRLFTRGSRCFCSLLGLFLVASDLFFDLELAALDGHEDVGVLCRRRHELRHDELGVLARAHAQRLEALQTVLIIDLELLQREPRVLNQVAEQSGILNWPDSIIVLREVLHRNAYSQSMSSEVTIFSKEIKSGLRARIPLSPRRRPCPLTVEVDDYVADHAWERHELVEGLSNFSFVCSSLPQSKANRTLVTARSSREQFETFELTPEISVVFDRSESIEEMA